MRFLQTGFATLLIQFIFRCKNLHDIIHIKFNAFSIVIPNNFMLKFSQKMQ